jgi:hypothetical protein
MEELYFAGKTIITRSGQIILFFSSVGNQIADRDAKFIAAIIEVRFITVPMK